MITDEIIKEASALVALRRHKMKYTKAAHSRDPRYAKRISIGDWRQHGSGWFSEVWVNWRLPYLVLKISGPAGFGRGRIVELKDGCQARPDAWPVFAEHCLNNPHPNLPEIQYLVRESPTISWALMKRYYQADSGAHLQERRDWDGWLNGESDAPKWIWPIANMASGLGFMVDLHSENVMTDCDTGNLIMTDPFSYTDLTNLTEDL